jgi:hypothetical protein
MGFADVGLWVWVCRHEFMVDWWWLCAVCGGLVLPWVWEVGVAVGLVVWLGVLKKNIYIL